MTTAIQRQPNVRSSTETLCSEENVTVYTTKQQQAVIVNNGVISKAPVHQHEQLGALQIGRSSAYPHSHDLDRDDEEIKSIISANQLNGNGVPSTSAVIEAGRYIVSNGYI